MTTTIQCQSCGNGLDLEIPEDIGGLTREVVLKLASMTVHNGCAAAMETDRFRVEESARVLRAMENWKLLTPPFFQSTLEWFDAGGTSPTLRRDCMAKAMAWTWGTSGLFLYGIRSGSGKTSSAYMLIRREVLTGKCAVAMSHTDFARKATFQMLQDKGSSAQRWIRTLTGCDLLFIDDFGKSRFKTAGGEAKQAEELLFDVIDQRITSRLPTILTSNDSAAGLKAKLSNERNAPLIRRLKEFFTFVNFDAAPATTAQSATTPATAFLQPTRDFIPSNNQNAPTAL